MSFPQRISVQDALHRVREAAPKLPSEVVPARAAAGRVLASDLAALADHPTVDNSALDGFACRVEDTREATAEDPVDLDVVGTVPAGRPWDGRVGPGQAVAIYTGGAVPDGADGIVPVEATERDGDRVRLRQPAQARDIRPAADDLRRGETYLRAGRRLDAAALGLVAAMGHDRVSVARRPRVALLTTGDEVVPPGSPLPAGSVYDANGPSLRAMLTAAGAELVELEHSRDTLEELEALTQEASVDLIVSSGGVSMGGRDVVRDLLLGGTVHFWKLRMKPGGPVLFAERNGTPWLGLPGNPVSSPVAFVLIGIPLLQAMTGSTDPAPYDARTWAQSDVRLAASGDKETFARVRLVSPEEPGLPRAEAVRSQSSGVLSALAESDALACLAPHAVVEPGDPVPVVRLGPYLS